MIDLLSIRSVTIDVVETYDSHDVQDQTAELVWRLLARSYQIYLFSSNQNHDLRREDFTHPGLTFLPIGFPPDGKVLAEHENLVTSANLWVTDDPDGLRWLRERGLPYATRWEESDADRRKGIRIASVADLAHMLNPTGAVCREVAAALSTLRAHTPAGALLLGIGGPPLSGFADLAVELKRHLESAGFTLVELLHLSPFVEGGERSAAGSDVRWRDPEAGRWLVEEVLAPAKRGERVYIESLPPGIPTEFKPHLPLFLHGESVVIAFCEMPYFPPLADFFDYRILLEVTPWETTRRIYEIDESGFEVKFAEQYLAHEGRAYHAYMEAHRVRERASLRVNANRPRALTVIR